MPLTSFLGLIALVILGAGLTLSLALSLGVPLPVIALVAMLGSLALGLKRWH
ncbi:hypothetical protein [Paracoccus sp. IB05]|uniref:hypothetical protein n=1 Tax=Paracoccus sp. IB05 TaxID=2779367 RepID=UPI0018E8C3FE|nr:hypothetical protein [Paracoccus sp. IB05]MBJ2150780.1 hypothetical protein [Paracoccus sp. IB05]